MAAKARTATAYAVAVSGEVDTCTIHNHARGAMVNFLGTRVAPWNAPGGQISSVPDRVVLSYFKALRRTYPQIQLVLVTVQKVATVDPAAVDLTAPPPQPPPQP